MWTDPDTSPDECKFGEVNGEEACFHYMLMDFEHFLLKDGVEFIDKWLSQEAKNKLRLFYASECGREGN
jgi:hypothetical protein